MSDAEKKMLCLIVTHEQEQLLEGIFLMNDWDLQRATEDDHVHYNQHASLDLGKHKPNSITCGCDCMTSMR